MNSSDGDNPPSDLTRPGDQEVDVVALMARIQAGAAASRSAAQVRLEALRPALGPLLVPTGVAACAGASQHEANVLFHQLLEALEAAGRKSPFLPPQWTQLAKAAQMDLHAAVTARLVGSLNSTHQALDRLEERLEEWDRQDTKWRIGVTGALEALFGIPADVRGSGNVPEALALVSDVAVARRQAELLTRTVMEHVSALAVRVAQAEEESAAARQEAADLRALLADIEGRNARSSYAAPAAPAAASGTGAAPVPAPRAEIGAESGAVAIGGPDFDFLVWEDLTRGDETAISQEQKKYLPWFEGTGAPVLDAGCGRGEFLALLENCGIQAYGIDADPSMVAHCAAKGLRVEQAELFDHLAALPDSSLGGLFLGQVVEHIPPPQLRTLTDLAFAKLIPGGAVVMETINPTCLTTFSGAFYADPTHQKPVHPKALEYFLAASGFGPTEIIFSAPVAPDEKLVPVREEAPLDPAVKAVVMQLNANLERLNSVLYSYGNYAAAARKPL